MRHLGNVALTRHLLASADSIDTYIAGPDGEADPLAAQTPPRELSDSDAQRWRAGVADTEMHAFGWSRQQAIDYFVDHSPLSRALIEGEVDRYIGMPGQALSYMIGRLRDRCRSRRGRAA